MSVESTIEKYSKMYAIDPVVVKALAWQESRHQQRALGPGGEIGVMQLHPNFALSELKGLLPGVNLDSEDGNIQGGIYWLVVHGAYQLVQNGKKLTLYNLIRNYNASVNNLENGNEYFWRVMNHYLRFKFGIKGLKLHDFLGV